MSAQHTPGPGVVSVKRGPFGGHVVRLSDGRRGYTVIVLGSALSATCEYVRLPTRPNARSAFVSKDVNAGPLLDRLTMLSRAAIAKATGAAS